MAVVQTIMPYQPKSKKEQVAAYCRVSSDSSDQLNSYRAQIAYYTDFIGSNPDWELADIYADEGITGTSMEKRDAFLRMIEDCRAGKIDRILVKSVSRFARNYIEQLETTRELAELGIVVEFEEQHIDTSQMLGEMQLTLHAVAAENESRSISDNTKWSIQKRMQNGTFTGSFAPYGYRLVDGQLTIDQEEADVVKQIFNLYLSGKGHYMIAKYLNQNGVPPRKDKEKWLGFTVGYILSNEKYTGDYLSQKEYTPDVLPFKKRRNKGERPKYYAENHHPAIISPEIFAKAQELLGRRKMSNSKMNGHLFTHRIQCPDCKKYYRQVESQGKAYWICHNQANGLTNCDTHRLSEEVVKMAFLNMIVKLYTNGNVIFGKPLSLLREMQFKEGGSQKFYELDSALAECREKALSLQKLHNKGFLDDEEYHAENEKLAVQRQKLSEERRRKLSGSKVGKVISDIEALQHELGRWESIPTEFDIDVFDRIVEKIIPGEGKLCFQLRCGISLWEDLP